MTELSGVDLARQALVEAREAVEKNGAASMGMPKTAPAQSYAARTPPSGPLVGELCW
ncbi:hypothetical protein ACFRU3_49100 [Streptomyces sp. NPDC056910]|uniref:hypothetical protein n=1 Tax=Streptomyces sp. NPDC056910 TaxID=3345964 RepID=UPI00369FC360